MVLALLIRSSLACLASRFSHCTQQGCWFGGFCHQKNSNSHKIWEQITIFQAHLSWFRYFCTGGQWLQTHLPKKPSDVEPAISRIPTLPVCLFRADPRDGPSVGGLHRGPQQAVRRNHEFHRPGLRALQRWSSRTSCGTPRAGHADPGDEPHGGSGSLAADRAFG